MDRDELISYVGRQRDGIISTIGPDAAPQAAYLAIASTDEGELVFDARPNSRKIANIRLDPRVAVVIGGADGTTLQCEGVADVLENHERERYAAAYVDAFPEFESSVHGDVVFVRVRLDWARYGDYRTDGSGSVDVDLTSAPPASPRLRWCRLSQGEAGGFGQSPAGAATAGGATLTGFTA